MLVRSYLSYATLLPRCNAVVSHAGTGTLLATLAHGLPSVLVPVSADQGPNAALAATAGAATTVNADGLRADAVAAALASILEQSEPLASARRIAVEIADMPSPAEVVSRLSSL